MISDIQRYVRSGFPGASYMNTKPREQPFLSSCWHVEADSESFLSWIWNMGPSFWSGDGKTIWDVPILNLPGRKISISGQGHDYYLLGLWRNDICGCDAKKVDDNSNAYIRMLKELRECCGWAWPHKSLAEMLLQHDNTRLLTHLKTQEAIRKYGWAVLPLPTASA